MPDTVTLQVTQGPMKGRLYTYLQKTSCTLGRGLDCAPRFPDDEAHQTISRRHCRIEIDPPRAVVRDLGSMNGTCINGRIIGRRGDEQPAEASSELDFPEHELKDGDRIRIGDVELILGLSRAFPCSGCGTEIPPEEAALNGETGSEPLCAACQAKREPPRRAPGTLTCAQCGRGLSSRTATLPYGGFLCSSCRSSPASVCRALFKIAGEGETRLEALRNMELAGSLGRGTSGAAFLARHQDDGRLVAVKMLLPEASVDETAKRLFLREVENSRHLDHPNVVRLYGSGSYEGVFFFTMEYCSGGSLDKFLAKKGGRLPVKTATAIILQTLDGLDYIHNARIPYVELSDGRVGEGRGLVHRDLKAANILLASQDGRMVPKIADVGVGKAFDTAGLSGHTRTGTVAGSPVSMPRQQVINFKYAKPDVDVWAMAATYYNLLTGEFPRVFKADDDPCLVVLKTRALPIRVRDASVPQKLADVIDEALVDNPEIKIKSALELKKAIVRALRG